jgi:plastocyanin
VCALWADIANGLYDSQIDAQATALKNFGYPAFFSFHHEPSTAPPGGGSCGTPTDYINAWRHIHDRFVADNVTNVTYALTLTALTYQKHKADLYYPGDDVIDVVAADGYNWFGCPYHNGPWREFQEIFDPFYQYAETRSKPAVMAEYGTGEDDSTPGRKAQWFTNAADTLKKWPLVKGVSYFNVGGSCARYVDTTPTSLAAFQADGADPYFNPPITTAGVTVVDFSFTPQNVVIGQGTGVQWTFNGPSQHTATDNTGLSLFDSGAEPAGATFTYYFIAAGQYPYHCTIHPSMTGTVRVPTVAKPPSGGIGTTFTITWAANHAPTNFVFHVQIRRPGSSSWVDWQTNQTLNNATFVPDSGVGTYSFRGRYESTGLTAHSNWSKAASIVVS